MSSNIVPAEKRFRVSLLLDTYGELLTEKQRTFLGKYYEEDLSFGEIARDFNVSRQAIFDSVKHGEASLEHYEKVLGLVRSGRRTGGATEEVPTSDAAERLREIAAQARDLAGRGEPVDGEWVASALEEVASDLGGVSVAAGRKSGAASRAAGEGGKPFLRGGGPDID